MTPPAEKLKSKHEIKRNKAEQKFHPLLLNRLLAVIKFMNRYLFVTAVCVVLTSCGRPSTPTPTESTSISVTAQGVRLASSKVDAGKATEAQLQQGLQSAADALSAVYAEARKSHPQLKGHLRGTFHIEAEGTPRMFMERGSEFTPVKGKSISDDFVGATFGGKWKFPRVGSDLMLTVDFSLE